ncbi:MAG: restriction endonuclease [Burkholderiaceae bacterium]|nr:restriction endonuclease [Burkholderiaceae bacterium]
MPAMQWKTYEEVSAYLLGQFAENFGVGKFEGKQVVAGSSGTEWEIDAKGCSDDDGNFIVVECKRHTRSGISQAITGALAWTIQDTGASGGILVSPIGLQEGAKKVAAKAGIIEVVLNENSTTTDYFMKFINKFCVGLSSSVNTSDAITITLTDKNGKVIDYRGAINE